MSTPEPLPVYIKLADGTEKKILGWACPECMLYHSPLIYACKADTAEAEAKRAASECCHRLCQDCGVDMGSSPGWICCDECRAKRAELRLKERIAKAKRVPWAEYHQRAVFCEATDEVHFDVDEMQEAIVELWVQCKVDLDEPPIIWGCAVSQFKLDADGIVDSELENHHEDAYEEVGQNDRDRLQRMLDKWCKDVDITSYETDYGVIVELNPGWWDEVRAEIEQYRKDMSE
jgi:hypothetical protein